MGVKLQTVPANRGPAWVSAGLRALGTHLGGYSALCLAFLVAAAIVMLVPTLGSVAMLAALPLLGLAFTMAGHEAAAGRRFGAALYLVPWRKPALRRPLLLLCLGYAAATIAFMSLLDWMDGGEFNDLLQAIANQPGPDEMAQVASNPVLLSGMFWRTLVVTLLAVPFWHAPALVVWGGQGAAQAMFSSTLALWRARGAYVLYSLGWMGVTVGVSLAGGLLLGLLGGTAGPWLLLPLSLLVTMAFYASLYPSYVDCFGAPSDVTS